MANANWTEAEIAERRGLNRVMSHPERTDAPIRCINCHVEHGFGDHKMEKGRCNACANYLRRTGHDRPKSLWGRLVRFTPAQKRMLLMWCAQKISVATSNEDDEQLAELQEIRFKIASMVV